MGVDGWVRHAYAYALQASVDTMEPSSFVCDVNLKSQYEVLSEEEKAKFGYERLLLECLGSLVRQCDKRVASNQERIAKMTAEIPEETMRRIAELEAAYKAKLDESERLGEVGEIEESMKLVAEAEVIKAEKAGVEAGFSTNEHGKRFLVCQTTGDLIESAAAADDAWMASHFESDDYQGWKTLREWHARLAALRDGRGPPRGVTGYRGPSSARDHHRSGRSDRRRRSPSRRRDRGDDDDAVYRYRDDDHSRTYARRHDDYYSRRDDGDYRRRRDRSRSRERRRDVYRAVDRRRERAESPGEETRREPAPRRG
mmetsp:Transcript_17163/g.53633  ORF Transcript_17163/g.53633 Transcript_17163/m.53633 type:complete len:313 (-) Transcript_17163:25-963(-)